MIIDIICPLYNGASFIEKLSSAVMMQEKVSINKLNFILTDTNDESEKILKKLKLHYMKIKKEHFSHSLTRESAAMNSKADIIVFITQDVIIDDKLWLYKLVKDIVNGKVSAAYSRQITKYNNIEKYTREKNYPEKSFVKDKNDINKLGLNTFFFSDVASATKLSIFKELNGYDHKNLPTNEDMYFAYKLIMNNKKIKYCADSVVYHSHDFTLKELYNRYKLTGKFFKENGFINEFGTTSSGGGMAKYVLKRILKDKRIDLLIRYPFDMATRLIGMKAGER